MGLALVASRDDAARCRAPKFFVEHGAGQTYVNVDTPQGSTGYAGGPGLTGVLGFICPNDQVAARWSKHYPGVPTAAVGCPKLDEIILGPPTNGPPTIAITFHWDCNVTQETKSALPHYRTGLRAVVEHWRSRGFDVIGHAHPRAITQMERYWSRLEVEFVRDERQVFARADMLVADNTSLLPEFLAVGRSVVFLNAPWYRRHVECGGRFWDWPRGLPQADDPDELLAIDPWEILTSDPERRNEVADQVYKYRDGRSAQRAADFILDVLEG